MQRELLRVQRTEQKGIFLVTHNLEEALCLADEILLLREGRIARRYVLPDRARGRELAAEELAALWEEILREMETEQ